MRINRTLFLTIILLTAVLNLFVARGQQNTYASRSSTQSPPPKPTPSPAKKTDAASPTPTPEPTAVDLIAQGKTLYRSQRFKQALAKFESALKQEPENDEALGLAAVTAFRLDSQAQSRDYFQRRADLPGQKDSIKAFSFYRIALTYWREVHDLVAKFSEVKDNQLTVNLPEREGLDLKYGIENGLVYADKALAIISGFAEAHNIKNLLNAEAGLAETDEEKARAYRKESVDSLRRAIELSKTPAGGRSIADADFSLPTIRVSTFTHTKEEEDKLEDPMMKLIEGGKPLKRMQAVFPSVRPPKSTADQSDASTRGVTSDGGAYSLGTGRGALTAAYTPGVVKIEVLISTEGNVVFAHVVDGRSDLNGAAVLAARNWKFEPAKFEGKPVQVSGLIIFEMKPGRARPTPTPAPKAKP
ncbi:MAG: energy transducer TonB [Blastocatellia bacterium]